MGSLAPNMTQGAADRGTSDVKPGKWPRLRVGVLGSQNRCDTGSNRPLLVHGDIDQHPAAGPAAQTEDLPLESFYLYRQRMSI